MGVRLYIRSAPKWQNFLFSSFFLTGLNWHLSSLSELQRLLRLLAGGPVPYFIQYFVDEVFFPIFLFLSFLSSLVFFFFFSDFLSIDRFLGRFRISTVFRFFFDFWSIHIYSIYSWFLFFRFCSHVFPTFCWPFYSYEQCICRRTSIASTDSTASTTGPAQRSKASTSQSERDNASKQTELARWFMSSSIYSSLCSRVMREVVFWPLITMSSRYNTANSLRLLYFA